MVKSINIPETYLKLASDDNIDRKYKLYFDNDIIVENEISYLNEGGQDTAVTLGTISTSDMKFEISKIPIVSTNAEGVKQIKRICLTITYEWKKLPFFKKTDAIIANWNSSVFTYLEDSFSAGDVRILDDQYRHTRNPFSSNVGLSKSGPSITFASSFATDTIADSTMTYYKY